MSQQDPVTVERVARALFDQEWSGVNVWDDMDNPDHEYWRRVARTAIEAIREPVGEMMPVIVMNPPAP